MTRSIERRIRHLRDTADNNRIQCTLGIEVRAAAALDGTMILREQRLSRIRVADRADGVVRADLLANTAARQ